MQKLLNNYKTIAFLSGILTVIAAVTYINFLLGWVCFVPLFMVIQTRLPKQCFKAGFIFGLAISISSFSWMVTGAERFTGTVTIYGYVVFIISSLFLSLYFALINYGFCILNLKRNSFSFFINALLVASIYVVGEALLIYVSAGLPWFGFHSGNSLINNIYSIQTASYFGIHGMSFIVVFVNYLIAYLVVR